MTTTFHDTYWLIEVGRNILHHLALPTTDPYSFASLRTPWIVYQWLTEVVLALANTFGLKGVAILGEVTLGLLLCVLIFRRMIRLGANSLVAFIVIAIVTHATYSDIATVRPQLFSFVFLFILQTILEDVWSAGAVGYTKLEIRAREDICDRSSLGELSRFLSAWSGDSVL